MSTEKVVLPEEAFNTAIEKLLTLEAIADVVYTEPKGLHAKTQSWLRHALYSGCQEVRQLLTREGSPGGGTPGM